MSDLHEVNKIVKGLNDRISELENALGNVLSEVEFEFGGWGDISILAEDEPDHYAVKAYEILNKK